MRKYVICIAMLIALMMGVAQGVTESNLIHRWSFDGAGDSVASPDGTPVGDADGALVLDGDGDYLSLPQDTLTPGLTSVTIEAWFELSGSQDWQRVFDFGETSGNDGGNMIMYAQSGWDTRFVFSTTGLPSWMMGEDAIGAPLIPIDTPTHIACVIDGAASEMRLYQDGALMGTLATTMDLSAVSRMNAFIGGSSYPGDPKLNGIVDEFRIWDAAFTDAFAMASYEAGPGEIIPEPATIAILGFGSLALIRRRRKEC